MTDESLKTISKSPLEQFLLLSKNAKGAAAAQLIKQATEAQGVYVFGELVQMKNIQEVITTFLKVELEKYCMRDLTFL